MKSSVSWHGFIRPDGSWLTGHRRTHFDLAVTELRDRCWDFREVELMRPNSRRDVAPEYPIAGSVVSGFAVRDQVPNTGSISASFTDYEVLPGIREVPLSDFAADPHTLFYARDDIERTEELARKLSRSHEINPLIVAVDVDGPYILEGGHRLGALWLLRALTFPALVVLDLSDLRANGGSSLRGELEALRPQMAAAADQVVQAWTQDEGGYDEEFGAGGACDEVARALGDVIVSTLPDVEIAEGGQEGDDHSFLFVWRGDEGYGVDIPPSVYKFGGGYVWRKKAGVTIRPRDIAIWFESVEDIVGVDY